MTSETLYMLIGGVAASLLALVAWHVLRGRGERESLCHGRCSSCGQKTRFRAARTGRKGRCPRCGHEEELRPTTAAPTPAAQLVGRRVQSGEAASR